MAESKKSTFRINEEASDLIDIISAERNISKSAVVEEAVLLLARMRGKLPEKENDQSEMIKQIARRLSVMDMNLAVLMEFLNALGQKQNVEKFYPTNSPVTLNPAMKAAQDHVQEKISAGRTRSMSQGVNRYDT